MNLKTALERLDEAETLLRYKKQRRYFSMMGFFLLLAHALTPYSALLALALAFFGLAIYRHIQFKIFIRDHKEAEEFEEDSETVDIEQQDATSFYACSIMPSISIEYSDKAYELSFQYRKEDWEDADILRCNTGGKVIFLHPVVFFNYLSSANITYLHSKSIEDIEFLEKFPCLRFGYLEDSRDYPVINIDGKDVTVQSKYLCPVFYIVKEEAGALLVVDELRDDSGDEIPTLMTKLPAELLENQTAEYSEEEGVWIEVPAKLAHEYEVSLSTDRL